MYIISCIYGIYRVWEGSGIQLFSLSVCKNYWLVSFWMIVPKKSQLHGKVHRNNPKGMMILIVSTAYHSIIHRKFVGTPKNLFLEFLPTYCDNISSNGSSIYVSFCTAVSSSVGTSINFSSIEQVWAPIFQARMSEYQEDWCSIQYSNEH